MSATTVGLLLKKRKGNKLKNKCNNGGSAAKDENRKKLKKMSATTVGLLLKKRKGNKLKNRCNNGGSAVKDEKRKKSF